MGSGTRRERSYYRVYSLWGLGFRAEGLGFRACGLGFWGQLLGFFSFKGFGQMANPRTLNPKP